jgi:hypothetical protein
MLLQTQNGTSAASSAQRTAIVWEVMHSQVDTADLIVID